MNFPESILSAIRSAVEEHPDDIEQSVECALQKVKRAPKDDYAIFLDMVERHTVQELVYRQRCAINTEIRRLDPSKRPAVPPQIVDHGDPGIIDAYERLYCYFVAGRTLGSLKGDELLDIAANEQEQGDGHHFRARLLRLCRQRTPDGKSVRESITGRALDKLFKRAEKEGRGEAA